VCRYQLKVTVISANMALQNVRKGKQLQHHPQFNALLHKLLFGEDLYGIQRVIFVFTKARH
jgi:hypothetical protein